MEIDLEAKRLEPLLKALGRALTGKLRYDHAADVKPETAEGVHQTENVEIVGDPVIPADLVLFNIGGVDRDYDLSLVLELKEHLYFVVRSEAGQDAGGVVIVEKLAAELEVKLASEFLYALLDVLRLQLKIFFA